MNRRATGFVFAIGILGGTVLFWQLVRGEADRELPTSPSFEQPADRAPEQQRLTTQVVRAPEFSQVSIDDDPIGPLRLEGVVLDQDNRPVAGATVFLSSHPPRTTISRDDGSFYFEQLVGRMYALSALDDEAAGGPVLVRLTTDSAPVAIRVREGARIEVAVIARADGGPIEGATVGLFGNARQSSSTNRAGNAELSGVLQGNQILYAEAPGYARHKRLVTIASGQRGIQQRVELTRGVTIAGRVVDPNGKPVAGAQVIARDAGELGLPTNRRIEAVVTDKEGRFTILALAAGSYRFVAQHTEHPPSSTEPTKLDGQTERSDIVIVMEMGGLLAGQATDARGHPVPWANIHIGPDPRDGGLRGRRARSRVVVAGEDGRFRVKGVARTALVAMASSETASSDLVAVDLREVPERDDVELVLSIQGVIAGVVVDESGEPIAEAQVAAIADFWAGESLDRAQVTGGPAFATTDGGGGFRITGLPDGAYQLRAVRDSLGNTAFLTKGTTARAGDIDVRIVLPAQGGLIAKLTLSNGKPPELATVSAGAVLAVPVTNGKLRIDSLVPGTYDVTVRGPQFADHVAKDVEIRSGAVQDLGTLRLQSGRAVHGRVVDHRGAPVGGAQVIAARQLIGDGNNLAASLGPRFDDTFGIRRATSDADGGYRVSGIGAGELVVSADHPDRGRAHAVTIPPGTEDLSFDLALAQFGSLKGHVTHNGEPAAGAMLIILSSASGKQRVQVQTGPDGSYAAERLAAGAYKVTATVGAAGAATMASRDVTISAHDRAQLDLDIVTGQITLLVEVRGENDAEIDAAQVFVLDAGLKPANAKQLLEIFARSSATGAKVTFAFPPKPAEFSKMTAGAYSVCVLPITGNLGDPSFAQRIQRHVDALAVYCKDMELGGSPEKQRHIAVVPPMNPLPE